MSAQTNKQRARDFIDQVWSEGKLDRIDAFISSDYAYHDPLSGELQGVEALRQQISEFRSAFPDLHVSIDDLIAEEDRVVARWTSRGTHRGAFMGVAPTNKQITSSGVSIERISDGKSQEGWQMWDVLGFMGQLGVAPELEEMAK